MGLKKKPKIKVTTKNQGFQKEINATFIFDDKLIPKAQDSVSLGTPSKKWIQFGHWQNKPHMTREDGETFIKEWKEGNVYYSDKNKRRWHKSKVRKHLVDGMKDNLEAIDLLRTHNLL